VTIFRCQVSIANDTNEARDVSQNTFHFQTVLANDEVNSVNDIETALIAFYNNIDSLYSANCGITARIKTYSLHDPTPRAPVDDITFTFTPAVTAPVLPNEVAAVLSFRGANLSGVNRRRNRGRIYLGPLATEVAIDDVGDTKITSAARTTFTAAADSFLLPVPTPTSADTIHWGVFSKSDALGLDVGEPAPAEEPNYTPGQAAAGFHEITQVWMDDAFDTQRRRGHRSLVRTIVNA